MKSLLELNFFFLSLFKSIKTTELVGIYLIFKNKITITTGTNFLAFFLLS